MHAVLALSFAVCAAALPVSRRTADAPSTTTAIATATATATAAPSPAPGIIIESENQVFFVPPASSTASAANDQPVGATNATGLPILAVYYPDWVAEAFPPESLDFSRIDWVDYAFAVPHADFSLGWDGSDSAGKTLDRLVSLAHAKGKKVKISVGGWTGSKHFSDAVANEDSRTTFVSNIVELFHKHNLDGVDIDWEYPGRAGNDGNKVGKSDTANFLKFLQLLRSSLPTGATITAAATTVPFAGPNGESLSDAHEFADVLDWVLMMNYDVWQASENPGPDAPLDHRCNNSTQPEASAEAAIKQWMAAGFPASKLVLGLPAYGYVSSSKATSLRQRDERAMFPVMVYPGEPAAQPPSTPTSSPAVATVTVTVTASATSTSTSAPAPSPTGPAVTLKTEDGSSQIQFRELVKQGALCASGAPTGPAFVGCGGFERVWDECSSTPFLRSEQAGQVVTYDDTDSIWAKADLARKYGLRGVDFWDAQGDVEGWALVDAARHGLGL